MAISCCRRRSRASRPELTVMRFSPSSRSIPSYVRRVDGFSSTMRMLTDSWVSMATLVLPCRPDMAIVTITPLSPALSYVFLWKNHDKTFLVCAVTALGQRHTTTRPGKRELFLCVFACAIFSRKDPFSGCSACPTRVSKSLTAVRIR
jgi:hypothetical protein